MPIPVEKRFKIFIAVYLILREGNKILLQQRANTGFMDGMYGLVSGHVDENESPKEGLIREAQEEANLILTPEDLNIVHISYRKDVDRTYCDIYMQADKWQGEIKIMEPESCSDLSWFEIDGLPDNIIPYINDILDNIQKGNHFSEVGFY